MEEKILTRIRKMMAIANDSAATEHERDTALQMSYRLLAKHNLTMLQVDQSTSEPRDNYKTEGWSQLWAKQICLITSDLFFCSYYYGNKINATKCVHHFVGLESNATTAMLMSAYIINSILKECRARYTHNLAPESRSFALGCARRLRVRVNALIAEEQQANVPGTALALINLYKSEKDANEALLPDNLKPSKGGKSTVKALAYEAGKEFGNKINLSKQVGNSDEDNLRIKPFLWKVVIISKDNI